MARLSPEEEEDAIYAGVLAPQISGGHDALLAQEQVAQAMPPPQRAGLTPPPPQQQQTQHPFGQEGGIRRFLNSPSLGMAASSVRNFTPGAEWQNPVKVYQDLVMGQLQQKTELATAKAKDAEGGLDIGKFNPRDYTVESFNEFQATGDSGVLVRHQPRMKIGDTIVGTNPDGSLIIENISSEVAERNRENASALEIASGTAKNEVDFNKNRGKKIVGIRQARRRMETMEGEMSEIEKILAKGVESGWDGMGWEGLAAAVPGTTAKSIQALLEPLKAKIGFGTLQEMRAASETGGALGQVTERELKFLQSVLGSLDQTISAEELKRVFQVIRKNTAAGVEDMEFIYDMEAENYGFEKRYSKDEPESPASSREGGRKVVGPDGKEYMYYEEDDTMEPI